MTDPRPAEPDLDALFAAARAAEPDGLPPAFEARLVAAAAAARPAPARRPGWAARLRAALADLGGAPALGGLAVAGVAGLWIGLADPADAAGYLLDAAAGLNPALTDLLGAASPFDLLPSDL
jgi:hypothetical protein